MSLANDDHIGLDQPIGTLRLASYSKSDKPKNTKKPHIYKGVLHLLFLPIFSEDEVV